MVHNIIKQLISHGYILGARMNERTLLDNVMSFHKLLLQRTAEFHGSNDCSMFNKLCLVLSVSFWTTLSGGTIQ